MGKTSRRKGSTYERVVAAVLAEGWGEDFRRTPMSGGWAKEKVTGDIVPVSREKDNFPFSIECKNRKTLSVPAWLEQAKEDCPPEKLPLLIFHLPRDKEEYVCLKLSDFTNLVKDFVIESRQEKNGHNFKQRKNNG